jgi:hypothetical protein
LAASWNDDRRGACSRGQELYDESEKDIGTAACGEIPRSFVLVGAGGEAMSKPGPRLNRGQIKTQRKARKGVQKVLREELRAKGYLPASHATISNHKCEYESVAEERTARNEALCEQVRIFRSKLPLLLARLSKIEDPRNPKKIKHQLTVLMIYGILTFVFQMSSCREANREMTRPMFWENLKFLFPEFEDLPHHDTLKRLLSKMDVMEIEKIHIELIRQLIRKKKFRRYLIDNCYSIAVDGTQKFKRDWLWDEECLERTVNKAEGKQSQYYVYVLEANLAFRDGMTIPLMSEFLSYQEGDPGNSKQDCELKAFYRLAPRLKEAFPALPIMVFLDGLYANGPVMKLCRKNKWQFMIVLQDKALPSVMGEFDAISELESKNRATLRWGSRRQQFRWANEIEYWFEPNDKQMQIVHVVECVETWQEVEEGSSKVVARNGRHVWLSSEPLERSNLHERCNLGARSRWTIETGFLVEKHHGYHYEHCFSYDWNAMKGYHYLMRLGHLFNTLSRYAERLAKIIRDTGVRGFIRFIRQTMAGPWLVYEWIAKRLSDPFQLRLI